MVRVGVAVGLEVSLAATGGGEKELKKNFIKSIFGYLIFIEDR